MLSLSQIWPTLEPYRVLADLAMPISSTPAGFHTEVAGEPFWFDRTSVVSLSRESKFIAGDLFDFLAFRMGAAEAVDHLQRNYATLSEPTLRGQCPASVMTDMLTQQRRGFESLMGLRSNFAKLAEFPEAALWMRARDLTPVHLHRTLMVSRGAALNEILHLVGSAALKPKDAFIAMPYFSDWHAVSWLRLENATSTEDTKWIEVNPSRHSWLGLHTLVPGQHAVVHERTGQTLRAQSWHMDHGQRETSHLHLKVSSLSTIPGRSLPGLVFLASDAPDLQLMTELGQITPELRIGDISAATTVAPVESSITWDDYAMSLLRDRMHREGGYLHQTRALVEQLKADRHVCDKMGAWLEKLQDQRWFRMFKDQTRRPQTFHRGPHTILETKEGYAIRRTGSIHQHLFTNFTIQVDRNVWFPDTQELWHDGRVVIGDNECGIRFSHHAAGKAEQLEHISTSAVLRAGRKHDLPVIIDPAARKHLVFAVTQQIASRPRTEGIRQMGWNESRTRFSTTRWRAAATGAEPVTPFYHPGNDILERCFTFDEPPSDRKKITRAGLVLVAVFSAMIARTMRRLPVKPLPIHQNTAGASLLAGLFRQIGQVNPAIPRLEQRGTRGGFDEQNISGLPLWLAPPTMEAAEKLRCPGFYLADAGPVFDEESGFGDAGHWIPMLAVSLLQRPETALLPDNPNWDRLVFEGRQLLLTRLSLAEFDIPMARLELFRHLVSDLPAAEFARRVTYDLTSQHGVVEFDSIKDRNQVLQEMQDGGVTVLTMSGRNLAVPMEWLNNFLAENLSSLPRLRNWDGDPVRPEALQIRTA